MKKFLREHPITFFALLIVFISILFPTLRALPNMGAITWDAFGYYYYNRLIFIDHTLTINSLDEIKPIFELYDPSSTLYQFTRMDDGRYIVRYPIGQALLYLPFFILGHIAALLSDFPADGFSRPYDHAIRFGGLIYHTLGFYFIAKLLALYFKDTVIAITLVVLLFGTNTFQIIAGSALSAQGSLFFLIPLFIWLIDKYYRNRNTTLMIYIAALFGLICLNRPTDCIIIVPALLWPLTLPGKKLKDEWRKFFDQRKDLIVFGVTVFLCALIQFGYWKHAGGSWLINSYGNPAEGLDFLNPHTIPFLFSFKSGWLLYTPVMLLVLIYLIVKSLRKNKLMQIILLYSVLFIFIASTWTNWWYGGGFSQRAMVQAYAFLSIPLAALINFAFFSRKRFHFITAGLISIFFVLSIWQGIQAKRGVLTGETVTATYYAASFFDYTPDPEKSHLLALNRYDIFMSGIKRVPDGYHLDKIFPASMEADTVQLEGKEFLDTRKVPHGLLCQYSHCWIRYAVTFRGRPNDDLLLVTLYDRREGPYGYNAVSAVENIVSVDSITNTYVVQSDRVTPEIRSSSDLFISYLWNRSQKQAQVIDMQVEVYAPDNEKAL